MPGSAVPPDPSEPPESGISADAGPDVPVAHTRPPGGTSGGVPTDLPDSAAFWAIGRFDERLGYSSWRPEGAGSWLLMLTDRGAGVVRQGGVQTRVDAGDAVLLGPGMPQFYGTDRTVRHWRFWWVHFWLHTDWRGWLTGVGTPAEQAAGVYRLPGLDPELLAELDARFRRAHAHARWPGLGPPPAMPEVPLPPVALAGSLPARQMADADVGQILLLLRANTHGHAGVAGRAAAAGQADTAASTLAPGIPDPRVERVRALIRADPRAAHTVAGLAAAVALSPSRLAHLFRDQVGQSVMQEVRLARLEHAARLLEGTALSVAEIAAASGFASPFHFSRTFSAQFGLPPREYRRAGPHTFAHAHSRPR